MQAGAFVCGPRAAVSPPTVASPLPHLERGSATGPRWDSLQLKRANLARSTYRDCFSSCCAAECREERRAPPLRR